MELLNKEILISSLRSFGSNLKLVNHCPTVKYQKLMISMSIKGRNYLYIILLIKKFMATTQKHTYEFINFHFL